MQGPLVNDARHIFRAALAAADAGEAVRRTLALSEGDRLKVGESILSLSGYDRIYAVGAGKAVVPMAAALEDILGERLTAGAVVTKYGHAGPLSRIEVMEADHPIPDTQGLSGVRKILKLITPANERDLVFCLFSGGASALMPHPAEGLTLHEKQTATTLLLKSGARIHEVNTVRKHLSMVKGGRLLKAAHPAKTVTIMISDVIGDDPSVIASGPTSPDSSTFGEAIEILSRYGLSSRVPRAVSNWLERGARGEIPETPKPGDPIFDSAINIVAASLGLSLNAAEKMARSKGYNTLVLTSRLCGEAREAARALSAVALEAALNGRPVKRPACIISGGETTVTVAGGGLGGRNQELALSAALELDGDPEILLLSIGTDGSDGPTRAAGALADNTTVKRARAAGLSPEAFLKANDSHRFFEALGDTVTTGPTRTNVMDMQVFLIP
ncbi:MAG: glycerate kinase [Deltaproteobacteria bacterium]|nr:glycerate kinase [Deltaproteobacteria bacterium]